MGFDFKKLFGDAKLQKGADGEVDVNEALQGKAAVGIYFSAHWCGPCRGFTPELVKMYNKLKAGGKSFEIVFASSDKTATEFDKYYKEMPWLALDFDERETKAKLSKKFKVQGIPTLVILDGATGETITADGRSAVMSDPEGAKFPWKPKTFQEALGQTFETQSGAVVDQTALAGKYLGLYFSASWCPPCKMFSPILTKNYEALKAAGKPVEYIYVSSDRDDASYKEYRSHFPFLSVPFADRARKQELGALFEVEGIPTFILIGPDGKVVNANARGAVTSDPEGARFPWYPPAVVDIEEGPDGINDEVSLLLFTNGKAEEGGAVLDGYTALAKDHIAANADKEDGKVLFFISHGRGSGSMEMRIRELLSLPSPAASSAAEQQAVVLDIPNGRFVVCRSAVKSVEDIKSFLGDYQAGKLASQYQSFK